MIFNEIIPEITPAGWGLCVLRGILFPVCCQNNNHNDEVKQDELHLERCVADGLWRCITTEFRNSLKTDHTCFSYEFVKGATSTDKLIKSICMDKKLLNT